jgi:hypothetical protein
MVHISETTYKLYRQFDIKMHRASLSASRRQLCSLYRKYAYRHYWNVFKKSFEDAFYFKVISSKDFNTLRRIGLNFEPKNEFRIKTKRWLRKILKKVIIRLKKKGYKYKFKITRVKCDKYSIIFYKVGFFDPFGPVANYFNR